MRLLVIEDELKTATFLKKGLTENRFVVDVALDGERGLLLAEEHSYDLVILDIGLPDLDGFSVLSRFRELNYGARIIFLTARDTVADRVRGLNIGADDYLMKPFAFSELLARIRSLLRRSNEKSADTIVIADLAVDSIGYKVTRAGQNILLTPKEFQLLSFLARRQGEVISRTLLAEKVWDINFDTDTNVIDVHIKRLRSKIDDPFPTKLIHTVRGTGYTLEARRSPAGPHY